MWAVKLSQLEGIEQEQCTQSIATECVDRPRNVLHTYLQFLFLLSYSVKLELIDLGGKKLPSLIWIRSFLFALFRGRRCRRDI